MRNPTRNEIYKRIWSCVKAEYGKGFCVSEHGLQAVLYAQLRRELPNVDIVVEPTWYYEDDQRQWSPDLVIVEGEAITDIFELKFVPHGLPEWSGDIQKLHGYVQNTANKKYPVSLDTKTGMWKWHCDQWHRYAETFRPRRDCQLHFVAVGQHDAEAMYPDEIVRQVREVNCQVPEVNFWYGRVGNGKGEWDIQFAS